MLKLKFKATKKFFGLFTSVTVLLLLCVLAAFTSVNKKPQYATGINEQINFQGRLLTASGAVVPDGSYNIRFKIYQDGDGVLGGGDETLKWTETRDSGNKVVVKNGYFSVYLGSVTALTGIDWNQSVLWLSIDIGGTGSPSYDGEMTPFNRLGSTPYALNAKQLGGISSSGFVQLGPSGVQADASTNNSVYINKTNGTGNILQLQRAGVDVFTISNSGVATHTVASTSGTAGNEYSLSVTMNDTGVVSTGTDDTRGVSVWSNRNGGTGSGVINNYGLYALATGDTGGTSTAVGVAGVAYGADLSIGVGGTGLLTGSGGVNEVVGVLGQPVSVTFTGTATTVTALQGQIDISTAGTYTTGTGLLVKTATATGGGAITTNYGAWIQTQTAGASDYGLRVDTAETQTLWIAGNDADPTTSAKGIAFGTSRDTNLYRGAANELKTDDSLVVAGATDVTGHSALGGNATADYVNGTALLNCGLGYCTISNEATKAIMSIEETITDTESTNDDITVAQQNILNVAPTAGLGDGIVTGLLNNVIVDSGNSQTIGLIMGGQSIARPQGTGAISGAVGQTGEAVVNLGATTLASAYGLFGNINNQGAGTITSAISVAANMVQGGTGNITTATGLQVAGSLSSSGNITSYYGINVTSFSDSGGGVVTDNYGVWLQTQTAGASNYGLRVDTATTQTVWIGGNTDGTTAASGIKFGQTGGTSVSIYRGGNNTLATDATTFSLTGASGLINTTGTNAALTIQSNGVGNLNLGNGGTANTIQIGNTTGAVQQLINIGTNATASSATPVTIGSTTGSSKLTLNAGTFGIDIGNNAVSNTLQIGAANAATNQTIYIGNNSNASGVSVVSIGSNQGASATTIHAGSGNLNLGNSGISNTIQIGNTTGAVSQTINIGNNATASSTNNVTIGSTVAGTTAIQGTTTITGRSSGTATTASVINGSSGQIGLLVKGASSQSANLQEWQDSGSFVFAAIGPGSGGGQIKLYGKSAADATGNATVNFSSNGGTSTGSVGLDYAGNIVLRNSTAGGMYFDMNTGGSIFRNSSFATVATISNAGAAVFKNSADSSTAFQVQDTGSAALLKVDTAARSGSGGNLVKIGNSTGTDTNTTILQLDGTTADPTTNLAALNGGLFYDSSNNKVKIIENGTVKTLCNTTDAGCGAGGAVTLQSAYAATSGNTILATDARDLAFTFADTSTDPNFVINLQCVTSCGANGRFAVQSAGTDVLTVAPTGTITATKHLAFGASSAIDACSFSSCPSASFLQHNAETFTGTALTYNAGIFNEVNVNSGANSSTFFIGSGNYLVTQNGNTRDYTGQLAATYNVTDILGSGTVSLAAGVLARVSGDASAVATLTAGLYVDSANFAGGSAVAANYGALIKAQSSGVADYGIAIEATDTTAGNATLWLSSNTNSTTASGGITFGSSKDTNLYRSAVATLRSDSYFDLETPTSTSATAGTQIAQQINFTDTGVVTTGTDITEGLKVSTTRTGATGGTINTYGIDAVAIGETGGAAVTTTVGVSGLAGGADSNYGVVGTGYLLASTNSAEVIGVGGGVGTFGGGGTATTAYALQGQVSMGNSATYTTAGGLNIKTATNAGGGTITANYGIRVDAQTVGTTDYGIRVDAADTQTLWLAGNTDSTSASAGIAFGSTVAAQANLYRGGDNVLKTDSIFQVGDATNASDVNFYGEATRKGVIKQTGLTNITDIFLYDTTADSDGGAWTNSRTSQLLSWYTETKDDGPGDACNIASDDRCDGSFFPRKALIVSTPDAVYIFDTNDMKLFMKFTQAGTYALGADSNNNPSSVFALNGVVYVGNNGSSAGGLYAFDFANDRMYNYNTTDRDQGDKNIANRNTTVTYATDSRTAMAIRHNAVNAVHGAVLFGSSSIETNGGPGNGQTFIAAATDDSMSVINLSGQVTFDYGDNLTDQFTSVFVTKRGRLYGLNATLAQVERYGTQANGTVGIDVAKADQATPTDIWDEQAANTPHPFKSTPTFAVGAPDALKVIERASLADESADRIYVGSNLGLSEINDVATPSGTSIGWSKVTDIAGQTAYMSGTPRGMFRFDETTGDLADSTIRNSVLEPEVAPTYGVPGVRGTAVRFNGTSQFLCSDQNNDGTCDTDSDFNTAAISFHVKAWFKHSATITGTDVLVDRRYTAFAGAEGIGYTIEMNSSGQMVFGIQDTAATAAYDDSVTSTQAYNDNQWHHLVAVNTDTGLCLYIDGKLTVACDTSLTATGTLDASQITTIGADASGASGGNFWDGDIDDMYFAGNGATTSDTLTQTQVRKQFLAGRSALARPSTRVTDATAVSSTTIGDSGETYVPNSFVGSFVEITGGTGAGQIRRVVSNDGTTMTVSPAWTVTPDTSSDYEVMPEQLYGSSDIVSSIGMTDANAFLGTSRTVYAGTNNGTDGGGITAFSGFANSYTSEIYSADAGMSDSLGNNWTGTDADDIKAIDADNGVVAFGSLANLWTEKQDRNIIGELDSILNNLGSVRAELINDGVTGTSFEVGNIGGADLAERYTSIEELRPGTVVSLEDNQVGAVRKSTKPYDSKLVGIVATDPGLIIGPKDEFSYPIALTGRVPVNVVVKNGESIKSGDRITSSDVSGYGMKAIQAGRVLGTALEELPESMLIDCPEGTPAGYKCGTITVLVNLVDFTGANVEMALHDFEDGGLELPESVLDPVRALYALQDDSVLSDKLDKSDKIIRYLLGRKNSLTSGPQSEVLTDRLSATEVNAADVNASDIVARTITADKIRANQIEGLEILTDKIDSLANRKAQTKHSSAASTQQSTNTDGSTKPSITLQAVTVALDMTVNGNLFAHGALKVAGPADFLNQTVFHKLATFIDRVVFNQDVEFKGQVVFNQDVAGYATIHPGQQEIEVKFDKPYPQAPVVNVTIKNGVFTNYAYKDLKPESFKIVLEQPANQEVEFAWSALQVKDAKTTHVPVPPAQ